MEIKKELNDNEYLLKIREVDNFGFLTKYNKNGTIPKVFDEWGEKRIWTGNGYTSGEIPSIQIHTEEFSRGWKFISYRIGQSQSWATVQHPKGFKLEIYLESIMDIVDKYTIVKGEIIGKFKWEGKKLISALSETTRERTEKFEKLQTNILVQDISDGILKSEDEELYRNWEEYRKLKDD